MSTVMEDYDDAFETAVFGRQVEDWTRSPLGAYVLANANARVKEALTELKRVCPWRRRRIQQLQNTVAVWEGFAAILAQAIEDGEQATQMIEER